MQTEPHSQRVLPATGETCPAETREERHEEQVGRYVALGPEAESPPTVLTDKDSLSQYLLRKVDRHLFVLEAGEFFERGDVERLLRTQRSAHLVLPTALRWNAVT
jgi:hypothetical protein